MKKVFIPLAAMLAACATARADAPTAEELIADVTNVTGILEQRKLPIAIDEARRGITEALVRAADPAARILTRAEYDHMMEERGGSDYASGIRISMTNGQPRVIAVEAGSPAADAGLQSGDIITEIDEEPATRSNIAACNILLRGSTSRLVRIQYSRGTSTTNAADVTLKLMSLPAIETAEELSSDLAYIKLNGLFPGSGREVVSVLRGWAETGRFGIVLDLRGAVGSDLASVAEIASLAAASDAHLYTLQDASGQDLDIVKASVGSPAGMPIMLLVDGQTAGAPEVLAAVMADSAKGAMVIGRRTSGDPMIREAVDLPSGEILYIATRRLVTADGTKLAGAIQPDIVVEPTVETAADYEPEFSASDRRVVLEKEYADRALRDRLRGDATFQRAVDVLLGLKALNIRGLTVTPDQTD
jgi:carboxyl-terminal processing protease